MHEEAGGVPFAGLRFLREEPKMRLWILVLSAVVLVGLGTATAQVKVWEGILALPTYEEGAPSANPPFEQFSTTMFNYPYTLREDLTSRRAEHNWRAVYLENEYLKCSVLPDIGGHLYTCIDKLSGQPMFYANPSIKKTRVGYRGSWAAFGIEFNFPISHNWVSMSPIPYAFGTKPDGSASVTVGNIDRAYGMEWSVELILRPGSTLLEERVTLNNRSDARHRFYWWNNAGIEVKDDSHIVYPMQFTASHGFTEVDTWPVDLSGADLSQIRNHTKGPVSMFVHGSREPFMGVWRPDTRTGTVHYADYAALPAKKIWSWGADADGLDWRKALSDNNSAYVEVQAGLFRNQETYAFLEPRQTISFSEFWMPLRDMGGIARATLAGVANMTRKGEALTVEFCANRALRGAVLRVLDGKRVVAEEKQDVRPERPWRKEVRDAAAPLTLEIVDANGGVLLRHTEGQYDWTPKSEIQTGPQKGYRPPVAEQRTDEEWAEVGKNDELNGRLLSAVAVYQAGLAKFPASFALMKSAGRLAATLSRHDEALRYLEPAAARATWDPEVAYYLGIAYEGVGRSRDARTAFENAERLPAFNQAGGLKLAELSAREGRPEEALQILRNLGGDLRVLEETVALQNAIGKRAEAQQLGESVLKSALSPFLEYETSKAPRENARLMRMLAADPDRALNIAGEYMRLGLYRRALDVLSREFPSVPEDQTEPGAVLPQNHPLVAYYRGYCHEKLGESAGVDDAAAEKMSTQYIFPSGAVTLDVLRAALRRNPQSATVHFLLGTQYFSIGLTDAALESWESARKLNAKLPVLHANIGRVLLKVRHDPARALEAFQEGAAVDPGNVELYFGMDQALTLLGRSAQERAAALERYPDLPNMPAELVYALALDRADAGDFDGAKALLRNRFFPRHEGGTNVRQVWIEVKTLQALSFAGAGKCDVALETTRSLENAVSGLDFTKEGLQPFVRSARTQYLIGEVEAKCSRVDEAKARWRSASQSSAPAEAVWAWRAARKIPDYDESKWPSRMESALSALNNRLETMSQKGFWAYAVGQLEQELGREEAARAHLTQAVLFPDRMLSVHLSRLALREASPSRATAKRSSRLVELTEAMISGVHWGQVVLQETGADKGDPELFGLKTQSLDKAKEQSAYLEALLALPTKEIADWSSGKSGPHDTEIGALVEKLNRFPPPASDRLPANVLRSWMAKRLTGPEDFYVNAVANLGQLSLEVEKDATQLQEIFRLYIALGLHQIDLPETDTEQLAAAKELSAQCGKAPYPTDPQAWQFTLAKLGNWSLKNSGVRDRQTLARNLLDDPLVKPLIPALRAIPARRVAFLGHSMMMSLHWSTFGSWCDVAAEAARQVNPKFEYRDFQSGGLTATRAVKEHLESLLAYKPTAVYILVAMRTQADDDALSSIVSQLVGAGAEVYIVDDVRPWTIVSPEARKTFAELAQKKHVHLLEFQALAKTATGHESWAAIDNIHMRTPGHMFFARETLRVWAAQ